MLRIHLDLVVHVVCVVLNKCMNNFSIKVCLEFVSVVGWRLVC